MMAILSGRLRAAVSALSAALVSACSLAFAQTTAARFDLTGPRIDIRVTRDGKTLPIAAVPNLKPGDKIWLFPDLPRTQSVHYLLVAVFLRGTTNPPPADSPLIKRQATEAMGATLVLVGPASLERQQKAEELVGQHGYVMVPPYNDEKIIAGQGTMGLEILEDLPEVETVLVPVGGGGMISGIAAAIKLSKAKVKVIGVEPELASDAQASLGEGKVVQFPAEQVSQTMADGLRTQSVGPINFEHIRNYVDQILTVGEDEIRQATLLLAKNPKTVAEPSGAVAVAAFLFHRERLPDSKTNVAILSGGNIDPTMLWQLQSETDSAAASRPVGI